MGVCVYECIVQKYKRKYTDVNLSIYCIFMIFTLFSKKTRVF